MKAQARLRKSEAFQLEKLGEYLNEGNSETIRRCIQLGVAAFLFANSAEDKTRASHRKNLAELADDLFTRPSVAR